MKINYLSLIESIIGIGICIIGIYGLSNFNANDYLSTWDIFYNLMFPLLIIDFGLRSLKIKNILKK